MFEKLARVTIIFSLLAVLAVTRPAKPARQIVIISQSFVPRIMVPSLSFIPSIMVPNPEPIAWMGLDGGSVVSLAIDPQNLNTLYLGTWGAGVYKSLDAGQTWHPERSGLATMQIVSLAVDPHNSSVVYAGTYKDKLYKSIDSGASWALSSNGIQNQAVVYTIAIDPVNSRRVVIGTRGIANTCGGDSCPPWAGVLYKTEDGGSNWTVLLDRVGGSQNQFWAYSVAFDPIAPNRVQAAYDGAPGIMRSLDAGNSWGSNNTGITNPIGRSVIFDPNSASTAYYGGWQGHQYPSVFKTTDGGKTWVSKSNGLAGMDIVKLAASPDNPAILFACTFANGLLKSTNGGNNWVGSDLPDQQINDIAINPTDSQTIYVGAATGLYKTSNRGSSWALSQHGLIQTSATSLQVLPADWKHLFMSTYGQGVLQSTDRGLTWSDMSAGLPDLIVHALAINPVNPNILFALTDSAGLFTYDLTPGGSWVRLSTSGLASPDSSLPPANQPLGPTYPFTWPDPIDQDVHPERYAAPKQNPPSSSQTAATISPHLAIVFASSDPNIAYIGTWGAQVYKTTNNGAVWNPTGLPGYVVWSLAVDPTRAEQVYAATSTPGAIKFSPNGGSSWSDPNLPSPTLTVYTLSTSPAAPGYLYAGTSNGVYQYFDGKWTAIGLAGQAVTALTANPALNGFLYAGTTNGAYSSADGGVTWLPGDPQLTHLTIKAITFDPGYINTVFYATLQSGVLKAPLRP